MPLAYPAVKLAGQTGGICLLNEFYRSFVYLVALKPGTVDEASNGFSDGCLP